MMPPEQVALAEEIYEICDASIEECYVMAADMLQNLRTAGWELKEIQP